MPPKKSTKKKKQQGKKKGAAAPPPTSEEVVASGRSATASIDDRISWSTYFFLNPDIPIDARYVTGNFFQQEGYAKLLREHVTLHDRRLVLQPLSEAELRAWDFDSAAEASMAFLRATELLDSKKDPNETLDRAKSMLLMSRAALWLARRAQLELIAEIPTGLHHFQGDQSPPNFAKFVQTAQRVAGTERTSRALALQELSSVLAYQVVNHFSPGLAESYLTLAESLVFSSEIVAAMYREKATKVPPPHRHGPWLAAGTHDSDASLLEEFNPMNWTVNIPGLRIKGADDCQTYLAEYWWGQDERTAVTILSSKLMEAIKHVERYRQLADRQTRDRLWPQENQLQNDLERRGAAALASLDLVVTEPRKRSTIEYFRRLFPGTPFDPTEEFVLSLEQSSNNGNEWVMTCMLGAFGDNDRTFVSVTDNDPESSCFGKIMTGKLFEGEVQPGEAFYRPPAEDIYPLLLRAFAGAGEEMRAHTGLPRRPRLLLVSYRMRYCIPALKKLLARVGVDCEVEGENETRFACNNQGTDFETGRPLDSIEGITADEQATEAPRQTLVGQRVCLMDLIKRPELNGRVGKVIRFLQRQERWEVDLESFLPDESPIKIAIRPDNLTYCPPEFASLDDYIHYRESVKSQSLKPSPLHDAGPVLEKLRATNVRLDESSLCAICQELASEPGHGDPDGLGRATSLPCGHIFHLSCILPWLTHSKMEPKCPCCRQSF